MRTIVTVETSPSTQPPAPRFRVGVAAVILALAGAAAPARAVETHAVDQYMCPCPGGPKPLGGAANCNVACFGGGGGSGGLPSTQFNTATELGTIFGRALGEALRGKSAAERQAEAAAAAQAQQAREAERLRLAEEIDRLAREAAERERLRIEEENRRLEGIKNRLMGSMKGRSRTSGLSFKGMKKDPADEPKPESGGLKFKLGETKAVERPSKTRRPAESWELYKQEVMDYQKSLTGKDPSNKANQLWCKGHIPLSMTANRASWEERCNPGGEVRLSERAAPPAAEAVATRNGKPADPEKGTPPSSREIPPAERAPAADKDSGKLSFKFSNVDAPLPGDKSAAPPDETPTAPVEPVAPPQPETRAPEEGAQQVVVMGGQRAPEAAQNDPARRGAPELPRAGALDAPKDAGDVSRQELVQMRGSPVKARLDEKAGAASGSTAVGTSGRVAAGYTPDGAAIAGSTPSLLAGGKVLRVHPSETPAKSLTPSEYGVDGRNGYSERYESFWPKETPVDRLLAKWDVIQAIASMQKTARGLLIDQGTDYAKEDLADQATEKVVDWLKRVRGSAAIIDRAFSTGEASNILERYTEGVKDDVLKGIDAASLGKPELILDSMDLESKRRGDLKQEVAEHVMGETGASVENAQDVLAEKTEGQVPSSIDKIKPFEESVSCHWSHPLGLGCSARFTH